MKGKKALSKGMRELQGLMLMAHINKIFRLKKSVNKSCEQSGLRGLAFKPYPLCVPADQAAVGFPFVSDFVCQLGVTSCGR